MPSVYDIKPYFQKLLKPLLQLLFKLKFTPNIITILALSGSFCIGIFFIYNDQIQHLWILPIWLFIRMALNAIDGMMARSFNMISPFGTILNELGDIVSDIFIYLPLAFVFPQLQWFFVIFVLLAIITEVCGLMGQVLGVNRHYEGPMGKSDRAFLIGVLGLFIPFFPVIISWMQWILLISSFLMIVTCINRIQKILKELKHKGLQQCR